MYNIILRKYWVHIWPVNCNRRWRRRGLMMIMLLMFHHLLVSGGICLRWWPNRFRTFFTMPVLLQFLSQLYMSLLEDRCHGLTILLRGWFQCLPIVCHDPWDLSEGCHCARRIRSVHETRDGIRLWGISWDINVVSAAHHHSPPCDLTCFRLASLRAPGMYQLGANVDSKWM